MSNPNLKENKLKRFFGVMLRKPIKAISPTLYVKLQYRYITHHKLHLSPPVRYTEKLQYLRLFVYPKWKEVSSCAGRATVRSYVAEKGYGDALIPCLGVYDSFQDIPWEEMPPRFVLKCTHASGWNLLVRDKSKVDRKEEEKRFASWLHRDYGKETMERHYSPIKPQIIAEEWIGDPDHLPVEYKIHVYNGKAKNLYVVTGRGEDIRYTELTIEWESFDGSQFNGWKKADVCPEKPKNWEEMVKMAEALCAPFPFVRCDLYDVNGKIYFGEMTFTPAKGTLILDDDSCDFRMGEWLDLSRFLKK